MLYAIVAAGVPLPAPPKSQLAGDERFPCEGSACGCGSAEQCWTKCCCRTLAGNLAWARAKGVRPPEFALAFARAQGIDTSHWDGAAENAPSDAIASTPRAGCEGCCGSRNDTCTTTTSTNDDATQRQDDGGQEILVFAALACQGITQGWLALGIATPPPPLVAGFELVRTSEIVVSYSDRADSVARLVDPPPPKRWVHFS